MSVPYRTIPDRGEPRRQEIQMTPKPPDGPLANMLTLDNLGEGAARELFQQELDKVLDNILDPNCEAKAKRSVSLDVTIVPSEDRSECRVLIEASSKCAPFKGAPGIIFVGRKGGAAVATNYNPRQATMEFDAPLAIPGVKSAEVSKAAGQ